MSAANEMAQVEQESRQIQIRFINEEDLIAKEIKSVVKELVTTKLPAMTEEILDDILRTSFHNAQSHIRPAVYNII